MNTTKRFSLVLAVSFAVAVTAGETKVWTGANNNWDWTASSGNFASGTPGLGDVVEIPAGMTAYVKDADSAAVVASLAQVKMLAEDGKADGKIVFDMGDADLTLNCALGMMADSVLTGHVVKKGTGALIYSNQTAFAYMAKLSIEGGAVRLPTATSGYRYGPVDIASGGMLITSPNGSTLLYGLTGAGVVTNELESGYRNLNLNVTAPGSAESGTFDFSGRIVGRYYYESNGRVMLRGENNMFLDSFDSSAGYDLGINSTSTSIRDIETLAARSAGVTGVAKIGLKGSASSVGENYGIRTVGNGGGLLYLGSSGEPTDRDFNVLRPNTGISFIDAGATGGLEWKGAFAIGGNASNNGMGILGLLGSNTATCVFSGPMTTRTYNNTNYCFFVEKAGAGTWRFADAPTNRTQRTFWSSMAVKNGTFQFDSMEEAGTPCALGLATNLTALYYGLRNDAAHPGPYAYWLGSAGKTVTFEFTGTNGAYATKRPIALVGDARLKNDTPHPWRFSGASPTTSGAKTLYLSGTGVGESEIAGISDTVSSPISIVKEGAGTWTLNGSNTFSGTVSVQGGTLRIRRDPGAYTWFKWTIRSKSANTAKQMYLTEFSLCDNDGSRVNVGLVFTNNWHDTQPGQISLPRNSPYSVSASRGLEFMVDGSTTPANFTYCVDGTTTYESPILSNPATWAPIIMRLRDDAHPVKYYDVCVHYPASATAANRSTNPNGWKLEGSADGIHWDFLHEVSDHSDALLAYTWAKSGVQYKSNTDTESGKEGYEIESHPRYRPSAAFTNTVSVSSGATIQAIGEVELSSIKINAANAGTIDGFSLAESGELEIINLEGDGAVEGMFANATNLDNLKKWTLSVNGGGSGGKMLIVNPDGTLKVIPRGFMLTVR